METNKSIDGKPLITYFLRRYILIILLGILILFFSIRTESFLTVRNLSNILMIQVTTGCMSIGALMILVVNEFDLSLGYLLGFCMMLGAWLAQNGHGAAVVIPAMLLASVLAGLISGIMTVKCRVSSFISTLAVGITLSGFTTGMSGGNVLSSNIPKAVIAFGQKRFFGVGYCTWAMILLLAVMYYILEHTSFGRSLYAIGGSERVAYLGGIKTDKVRITVFMLAGLFTGIAAVSQLGQSGSANPSYGMEMLMPAYAIALLSMAAYKLGTYNIAGLVLAILVVGVGVNGLGLIGATYWMEHLFNGIVLILAVLISIWERHAHGLV
ncbi:ABC transporter permease [Extibacter muris]|uniref:ABC transporter permease n=1 Tax=Extibacter muris TaxID=1796622 RepID=UPI001D07E074|nr:ABC transporter permease [Extibacter muris]MCB6201986.1 ABC transporter permease [Extibacter muris]MCQ4663341.1 ABC transporter permease [Extibacter muris]MCQ4692619.1 ABC transporter permease [Extibacter muris]